MFHRHASFSHRFLMALLLALSLCAGQPKATGQSTSPGIDFFAGVNLNFKDMDFQTQYKFLIHLTPGFKWNFGNHWQVAGQVLIPIVNQYGYDYRYVDLNVLDISKEFRISNLYLKASAGLFSGERYGLDLKAFFPLCDWFAFEGQAGWVGSMTIHPNWYIDVPNRFVWTFGGDVYFPKSNTQLRGVIGQYLYRDFGAEAEAMRHFNHTTVSLFGRWSNEYGFDAGFKVVVTLPPYHRTRRAVNLRPASNFRLCYLVMYHQFGNRMYSTDPEQNERDGWFSRDFLNWGSHTMEPDFIITDKRKAKIEENNETP